MNLGAIQSFDEFERANAGVIRRKSRFGRFRWDELPTKQEADDFLVDDWITENDVSVLAGGSKAGKSFLGTHMGVCIARGVDFFGKKTRRGLVIYVAGEAARGVVRQRLPAIKRHFKIPQDEYVPFETLCVPVDLRSEEEVKNFIEECLEIAKEHSFPLKAIFIDTVATSTPGADENSGKDMGSVFKNIQKIRTATGAHICLIHHMNAAGSKIRGHSSIYANSDQIILVTRDEITKVRTAKLDKQKDGEEGALLKFELMQVVLGERPDGKSISSCVVLQVGEKEAFRQEAMKGAWTPDPKERRVINVVLSALEKHGRMPTSQERAEHKIPETVSEIIQWSDYRETYKSLEPGRDDIDEKRSVDAIRKEFGRVLDKIGPKGGRVIGVSNPFMWMTRRPVKGFPETMRKAAREAETEQNAPSPAIDQINDELGGLRL